jgi:hypothetical protein
MAVDELTEEARISVDRGAHALAYALGKGLDVVCRCHQPAHARRRRRLMS